MNGKVKATVLFPCDLGQREMLEEAGKGRVEFRYAEGMDKDERMEALREAEIIFGEPGIREVRECPYLKWIQMSWAGTDIYTMREGFPRKVRVTNARGCFQVVIGEYIVAALLELCRNLRQYGRQQDKGL